MANSGIPPLVTVFGGGGFVGRYVCEYLLKSGVRLRVAERSPRKAWFLQPLGSVGQVSAVAADLSRPATIERAVEGASAVVNLVGVFKGNLDAIHVTGARLAAEAAKATGAGAFVQVSAIGADPDAESDYGRTKGLGEAAVREVFPSATIIRPSVVFGPEDDFTNRFASMARLPILPVIAPRTRFQPIYVRDLAQAIAAAALDPKAHGGKTYELGGPDQLTMRDLNAEIAGLAGQSPDLVDVPDLVAGGMAALGFLPGAPLSKDQWTMLQRDNVADGSHPGLDAFGIAATPIAAVAPEWLGRFHKGGRFAPRAA
ncbi:complex I NDUFA9 subunit family protein [Sphingomonas sp. LY160]|uniref:complex I NDUFA9 subunit family protein n=1 Tax=Sphingomonas sp. LY160 TaxID=3095342 RepID=UPI002ADED9A3|nr:complex I NDUFA9 subunit family protein [Sphingomonas sp. LY160]MEA1072064.1 complex I NDUFA9 subunit family protein [Sphingomonas sp. LY160]